MWYNMCVHGLVSIAKYSLVLSKPVALYIIEDSHAVACS